jgi:predicted nucleotidyltransferase
MTGIDSCCLDDRSLRLIRAILARNPRITRAVLFGSRAKGTATAWSDIDLAVEGIESDLDAEALASELDELPLPIRFDITTIHGIRHAPLREHIARVGIPIYQRTPEASP